MTLPFVSCLCPTYGRPSHEGGLRLLSEAIECFLAQDYPNDRRELIVLNDCPAQDLWTLHQYPGLKIFNLDHRVPTLGEKYNVMVRDLSQGEILLPWEDDDLSLPWRISQAVERLQGGYGYFNPQRSWFFVDGKYHADHAHGYCHNASAFTREAFDLTGGYPAISGAQDAVMDQRLKWVSPVAPRLSDDPNEWSYVYRWGMQPYHLSGFKDPEDFYGRHGEAKQTPGVFRIPLGPTPETPKRIGHREKTAC